MRKSFTLCLFGVLFIGAHPSFADKIYKCKNAKGILIYGSAPCAANVETLNAWTVTPKRLKPAEELLLKQDSSGHYFSQGAVNDESVWFVVDTGASRVTLPVSVAEKAKISCQGEIEIHTANGAAQACSVMIPKFSFGPFSLSNVEAIIAPNLTQPLLGMNVLQKYKIAQAQGQMHITER